MIWGGQRSDIILDIKKLNYRDDALRLYEATSGLGTDEEEVYKIAKDLRSLIAQDLVDKKIFGDKAVEKQNALMREALKYLGDAFVMIAQEKGEDSLIKSSGEETLRSLLIDELSGTELAVAGQLYGFSGLGSINNEDWLDVAQGWSLGSAIIFAEAAFVFSNLWLLVPVVASLVAGLGFWATELGLSIHFKTWDAYTLQSNAEWKIPDNYYYQSNITVNEDFFLHYFTNRNVLKMESELARLAAQAPSEEAWVYIRGSKKGHRLERLLEFGFFEGKTHVAASLDILEALLANPEVKVEEIRFYHLHPSQIKGRSEELLISPEDVMATVLFIEEARKLGFKGKIDARAVTPKGVYILQRKERWNGSEEELEAGAFVYKQWLANQAENSRAGNFHEQDAVVGVNQTGLVKASYRFHPKAV